VRSNFEVEVKIKRELQVDFAACTFSGLTGLHYFGARYLDSRLSMWFGVDPLAEKYPDWSPFVFTLNNPIRMIDPDGRAAVDAVDGDHPGIVDRIKQNLSDLGNSVKSYFNIQNLMGVTQSQKVESLSKLYGAANTSTAITNKALDVIDSGAECVGNTCDVVEDLALLTTALTGGTSAPVTVLIARGAEIIGNIALGVKVGTDYARDGKIDQTASQIVVKIVIGQTGNFIDKKISTLDNLGKSGDKTRAAVSAVNSGVINTAEKVANKKIESNKANTGTWWGGG